MHNLVKNSMYIRQLCKTTYDSRDRLSMLTMHICTLLLHKFSIFIKFQSIFTRKMNEKKILKYKI